MVNICNIAITYSVLECINVHGVIAYLSDIFVMVYGTVKVEQMKRIVKKWLVHSISVVEMKQTAYIQIIFVMDIITVNYPTMMSLTVHIICVQRKDIVCAEDV